MAGGIKKLRNVDRQRRRGVKWFCGCRTTFVTSNVWSGTTAGLSDGGKTHRLPFSPVKDRLRSGRRRLVIAGDLFGRPRGDDSSAGRSASDPSRRT